jgi:hypothetical protein
VTIRQSLKIIGFGGAIALLVTLGGFCATLFLVADNCGPTQYYYGCDVPVASGNSQQFQTQSLRTAGLTSAFRAFWVLFLRWHFPIHPHEGSSG